MDDAAGLCAIRAGAAQFATIDPHPGLDILARPAFRPMTKSELIDAVAQRTNITKSRAEQVVNCIFESMTHTLGTGQGIEIRGFGSFTVREYRGYKGRNPRTGDEVHVEPKRLPFFKVGKELKELVNRGPSKNE
jgi:integration host factor subunit beta